LTLLIFHRPSPSRHPPPFPTPRSSDLQGPALRHSQRADPFAHQAFQPVIFLRHGQNVMPSSQGAVASPWKPAMTGTRSERDQDIDRKSTRLNFSHVKISYAVFCLKKKT